MCSHEYCVSVKQKHWNVASRYLDETCALAYHEAGLWPRDSGIWSKPPLQWFWSLHPHANESFSSGDGVVRLRVFVCERQICGWCSELKMPTANRRARVCRASNSPPTPDMTAPARWDYSNNELLFLVFSQDRCVKFKVTRRTLLKNESPSLLLTRERRRHLALSLWLDSALLELKTGRCSDETDWRLAEIMELTPSHR